MSALPKAVRAQIAKGNKIAEEYYKSLKGETPPTPGAPVGDPPAAPPAGDPPSDSPPAPVGEPPAAAATPPAATPPAQTPPVDWEQRYKVLQGKYNAEVPRLQKQVGELTDSTKQIQQQLTSTQTLLASMSGSQRAPEPAAPPAPKRLVTEEEIKQFGPDLYDFVKRASQEAVLPAVDERLQTKLKPVAEKIDEVGNNTASVARRQATNDRNSVFQLLTEKVPKWATVNEDPAFLEWLDQVDPFSGYQRGRLLEAAFQANDGPRVVAFFRGYLNENAALNPQPTPPAAGAEPPKPQKKLDEFVAPGTAKPAAAGAPDGSGKRAWTRAEIGKFYEDLRAGLYRAKPDERKRIEADIFAAQREGRIR